MAGRTEYRFRIDVFTPDTLPMARLAEYMGSLASLLGNQERVHFVRIEPGSAVLVQRVDEDAVPKVQERVRVAGTGAGPREVTDAFHQINDMLARDNAVGIVTDQTEAEVIRFPGRETPERETIGPIRQDGSLYGELVSVGGIDKTIPVRLRDGDRIWHCNTTPEIARELAHHLLGLVLRADGRGTWLREADGEWTLKRFWITSFEVLDDVPLSQAIDAMRSIPGSAWKDFDDPMAEWWKLRRGSGRDD